MSTIKPPGASLPGVPVAAIDPVRADPAGAVEGARAAQPVGGARGADAAQGVLGDLAAGRITPDAAVARLTSLAVERSGATAAMRPALEQKVRALLASDPTLGALLGRMGATAPAEE